jgi:hypothetical protein
VRGVQWSVVDGSTEDVNEESTTQFKQVSNLKNSNGNFDFQLLHVGVLLRPDSRLFKYGSLPGTSHACMPVGYGSNSTIIRHYQHRT